MITLFVVSTFDGWDEIMNVAANSDISANVINIIFGLRNGKVRGGGGGRKKKY